MNILCATDFTAASDTALRFAAVLARRLEGRITLLHMLPKGERVQAARTVLDKAMAEQRARCASEDIAEPLFIEGDVVQGIAQESVRRHGLLISGTHGPRGLRQALLGADMLKVARKSAIPCLVVQEQSSATAPERIVVPVAGHHNIGRLLDTVVLLARAFGSEVHIFQSARPHEQVSEELAANTERMVDRFQAEGLAWVHSIEPAKVFSVGFAEATIRFAEQVGAGLIAIMAHASDEYRHIADAEKERMLINSAKIPVLLA